MRLDWAVARFGTVSPPFTADYDGRAAQNGNQIEEIAGEIGIGKKEERKIAPMLAHVIR